MEDDGRRCCESDDFKLEFQERSGLTGVYMAWKMMGTGGCLWAGDDLAGKATRLFACCAFGEDGWSAQHPKYG